MTAQPLAMTRAQRAERRVRLCTLIARASEELIALERADHRATRIASPVVEPPPAEVAITPTARIRAWATDNGYPIGDRGRIPTAILDAYQHAHPQEQPA